MTLGTIWICPRCGTERRRRVISVDRLPQYSQFLATAILARWSNLGYLDGTEAGPEDMQKRIDTLDRGIRSRDQSIAFLLARLKIADPLGETIAQVKGDTGEG